MKLRHLLLLSAVLLVAPWAQAVETATPATELPFCLADASAPLLLPAVQAPQELALPTFPACSVCSSAKCRGNHVAGFCDSGTPLQGRCSDGDLCPTDGKPTCLCTTGPIF